MSWPGQWLTDELGVRLRTDSSHIGVECSDLLGLALRRNPKRAQLLVSRVLGKHIPTDPRLVDSAGRLLGQVIARELGAVEELDPVAGELLRRGVDGCADAVTDLALMTADSVPVAGVTVLGYAETATALGHCVAAALAAPYLHSTRRPSATHRQLTSFVEAHSHATDHLLLPADSRILTEAQVLVLVDDELSTGATALATIEALEQLAPGRRYVIAALVDMRSAVHREQMAKVASRLGVRIDVVSLAEGELENTAELGLRVQALGDEPTPASTPGPVGRLTAMTPPWPVGLPEGGRHGITPAQTLALHQAARDVATKITQQLSGDDVLVLGFEELMYAPLQIAVALADAARADSARRVRFSSTTRSPVRPLDHPGYAIRTALSFPSHDDPADGPGQRYAYNIGTFVSDGAPASRPSDIVLVIDARAQTPRLAGLLDQLRRLADAVHVITLPTEINAVQNGAMQQSDEPLPTPLQGPEFGSYRSDEVSWLLTDLSGAALEAPTRQREEAIQSGRAHYAESLPVEYQPDAQYQGLYELALAQSSRRLALAVGVVTELLIDQRGTELVLASLARAGTPVGILMRRWAKYSHGIVLPHYAVSIVRDRGIDQVALRYLAAHHRPQDVVFVDGWTGKGAITRELREAVALANAARSSAGAPGRFRDELAVLADPGHCVSIYGTRDDFLIPSACLNSTVSGLVSRTVLNHLIGPNDFHGAKFYRELAPADVSAQFLATVTQQFASVRDEVQEKWVDLLLQDRTPSWAGWEAVEKIGAQEGIANLNLIKPGVGETTRVLLRRVPWKVLMRPEAKLEHVRHLAASRGVPIEFVDDLAFNCVGLIRLGGAQ